ncbi:altronate hydrolase [Clostridium acetobutylicum]|uniref:Altronate dehydratase n=1 Tax=Clostridium acetobutylicum (strain ATCC 824 / DSM 792 / JCM 1419 / IAM 19013 / LMG 5710 / NBRC 13948 / NRRL B-527 / VKM B-1787 / 2291 / W) TaxID=272562 RepID=Q97L66_CLOAB|nr:MULTISPECIES: altronate dehydratase family protein [Clostridium]AAK78673.1 Putative altronate dehydratase [Clostridium acetobutylicum ATCC 824]ADZ19746.1 Putative altronate dehydratase [Clostridium acetobutylicum EA 2018]AEI34244.1 putative altronate dehydratase [Clostridium acetobutylicum DSM 1731]AWV80392.1 altronate dehydratase [Clostridium acetobutylicum]MBC2392581.1 altronate dehydratase [Clostridium acetobutylicum]
MKNVIKINEKDNVVVALNDLNKGDVIEIDGKVITAEEPVKKGHKIAITDIQKNSNIYKYGFPIGHALEEIKKGQWVHTHNIKTNLDGIKDYEYNKQTFENPFKNENLTFKGYRREDGTVGIRNELWIVPTVGCVNGTADLIAERFKSETEFKDVHVFKHNFGCSQLGDDHNNTRTILGNIVKHPNAGGVLVLGLGCENNTMESFKESLHSYNKERVRFLIAQDVEDEISSGCELLKELYEKIQKDEREEVSISELKIGLKCGASDGFSGITANPLLGKLSDFLIAQGGTTILTEVPEMFGAETILMNRAKDEKVFAKTVNLINDFKKYFMSYNQPVYENPSPGNKAGGITTLEDKSLGCTQKSGSSEVVGVLKYGETLENKGLNLLSAPGNDLVASTALASAGCHMVLFTTGRGTPFGTFVPTVKISTNSDIYNKKKNWIDFNAGALLENQSMDQVLKEFINYLLGVANGNMANNEKNNIREISIFKNGVTL